MYRVLLKFKTIFRHTIMAILGSACSVIPGDSDELCIDNPAGGGAERVVLFGDAPVPTPGPANGTFSVAQSGQSIIFRPPADSSGQPAPVTSVSVGDDVQVLEANSVPSTGSLTLKLDLGETGAIPLEPSPPKINLSMARALPAEGTYDLALTWGYEDSTPQAQASPNLVVRISDVNALLGTVQLDQTQPPAAGDSFAVAGRGTFRKLGTFHFGTASSPELHVQFSGQSGDANHPRTMIVGQLRYIPTGSSDESQASYVRPEDSTRTSPWAMHYYSIGGGQGDQPSMSTAGGGSDFTYLYPSAASIQSAIQAIPGTPDASVQVADVSSQTTRRFAVRFTSTRGRQFIPTIVPSDPAYGVRHDGTAGSVVGGGGMVATINGVDHPISIDAHSWAAGKPFILYHLLQDTANNQTCYFGEPACSSSTDGEANAVGSRGHVGLASRDGSAATWHFGPLRGGATYRIDVTWPGGIASAGTVNLVARDGQGNVIATASNLDQTSAPTDLVEGQLGWKTLGVFSPSADVNTISVEMTWSAVSNKNAVVDAARVVRTSADRSLRILPTDQVAITAPAGFAATASGSMSAFDHATVLAASPRFPQLAAGARSLKIGSNFETPSSYGIDPLYSNMAVVINSGQPLGVVQDDAGNPTTLAASEFSANLITSETKIAGDGRGVFSVPNGTWVVEWQGSSWNTLVLAASASTTVIVEDTSRRVTGPTNRAYYKVTESFFRSPFLRMVYRSTNRNADGTFACDIKGLAIYPPNVDPDHPGQFSPTFLANTSKSRGLTCLRFMDSLDTNNLNLSTFGHFADPQKFPLGYLAKHLDIPITSIGPPAPDPYSDEPGGGVVVQIKLASPLPAGIVTGFLGSIQCPGGQSVGMAQGAVIAADGSTTQTMRDPINLTNAGGFIRVVDSTTLNMQIRVFYGPNARMVNTINPTACSFHVDIAHGNSIAPVDIGRLSAQNNASAWVNVPALADDDCVQRMALAIAQTYPSNTPIYVEFVNEVWNTYFKAYYHFRNLTRIMNGDRTTYDYIPAFVKRMGEVHNIFRSAWSTAGRDPADVRRVAGSFLVQPDQISGGILDEAIRTGVQFDLIAPATYFNNDGASGPLDDLLTIDQHLDLLAENFKVGDLRVQLAGHNKAIADRVAANPNLSWLGTVRLAAYEGGSGLLVPSGMAYQYANVDAAIKINAARINNALHRHPDFYDLQLAHLQMMEDAKLVIYNAFTLYHANDWDCWIIYESANPSVDRSPAAQQVSPFDQSQATSQVGAAFMKWATFASTAPTTPARKLIRNGSLRPFGYPTYGLR